MTASQLGQSPAQSPPPPASLPSVAVPGRSGNDISYSQMGLIIGLVLGGLFLIFLLVLAYICIDSRRERQRKRRAARSSGAVHDPQNPPEVEGSKIPGLPEGQAWTTVHDGIVGLELVDDCEGSEGSGAAGNSRGRQSRQEGGQHAGGGGGDGGGDGGGGRGSVLAVMRNAWDSASASFCLWDWRKQVSAPLAPLVEQQQQQQQQRALTPSRGGAAPGGTPARRGSSSQPSSPGGPSPRADRTPPAQSPHPPQSPHPTPPPPRPPPPPASKQSEAGPRSPPPPPPPRRRQAALPPLQLPPAPLVPAPLPALQTPPRLALLALPQSPAAAVTPGLRTVNSDGGVRSASAREGLAAALATLQLSALSNRSIAAGGSLSPTVPAAAAAVIPAPSPRSPHGLEAPYCAVRRSTVKSASKTPPAARGGGGFRASASAAASPADGSCVVGMRGVADGKAKAHVRRNLAAGASIQFTSGGRVVGPELGSLAMRPRWRI